MSDHRQAEKPVAIGERRIHARAPVTPQAFVKFGDNNYGFGFNISETGLVFAPTSSLTLAVGASSRLRFQLPDSKEWIQTNGEIVWIAESQKEAGVRFVDLTEDTRIKIRNWISQEPSHNEDPETQNKFSEGDNSLRTGDRLRHTIAIARQNLPPDALPKDKVLNSIFSDPGLFLVEAKSARVKAAVQPPPAVADELTLAASLSRVPERRSQPRRRVLSLEYLDLGDSNGGIILNISEGGMYIQAVASLSADELSDLSFRIPDSGYQVETSGKIVWVGESKKDAGIQFVNLPQEARLKLREWVAAENPAREEFRQMERPAATHEPVVEPAPSARNNERVVATPQIDQPKAPPHSADPPVGRVSFVDRLISKRPDSVAKIDPGGAPPVAQNPVQARPAASASEKPPAIAPSAGNDAQIANGERSVIAPVASTAPMIQEVSTAKPAAKAGSAARDDREVVAPASSNGGAKTQNSPGSKLAVPVAVSALLDGRKLAASDIFPDSLEPVIAVQRFSDTTVVPTGSAEAETQHGKWQRWAAVIAAIVLISFGAGWIAAGPAGRKQFLDIFLSQQSDSSPQPENPGAASAERDAPVAVTHDTASSQPEAAPSASSATAANHVSSQPVTQTPVIVAKEQPAGITAENVAAKKQPDTPAASSASSASNRSQQQPHPSPPPAATSNAPSLVAKNTPPPATSTSAPKPAATGAPKTSAPSQTTGAAVSSSPSPNANPPAAQPPARSDAPSPASQPKLPVPSEIVKGTVSVSASPFPSIRIPAELKSQISKRGAILQIGQLVSRVEPTYPEDAELQRIEGVVKLHAIIARDGSIQDIDQMSGPPLLAAAAASAVRQWRYRPTSLDGQPVEASESVTVTFRLQSSHAN